MGLTLALLLNRLDSKYLEREESPSQIAHLPNKQIIKGYGELPLNTLQKLKPKSLYRLSGILKMEMAKMSTLIKETWKEIKGFEEYYEVSNLGRVRNIKWYADRKSRRNNILKGTLRKSDYPLVHLMVDSKSSVKLVDRLVAETFLDNPDNLPVVIHIDGNITNNCIENLRWGNYSDSQITTQRTSSRIKNHASSVRKPVVAIDKSGSVIIKYDSQSEAERLGGYSQACISYCLNGKLKTHKGLIWKLAA